MKKEIGSYASFGITERGDAAIDLKWKTYGGPKILITKDPNKLLNNIKDSDLEGCIVHTTITGLSGTMFEPNIPSVSIAIDAYRTLVSKIGIERVVLRVDPIFVGYEYEDAQIDIFNYLIPGGRCRTSFMDLYGHVLHRFEEKRIIIPECYINKNNYEPMKHASLESRMGVLEKIKKIAPNVEVCGEPDLQCSGCVSKNDYVALKLNYKEKIKIGFQRPECECIGQKKELLENKKQCPYKCLYCYWMEEELIMNNGWRFR